jgi:hypothetical protein
MNAKRRLRVCHHFKIDLLETALDFLKRYHRRPYFGQPMEQQRIGFMRPIHLEPQPVSIIFA